MSNTQSDNLHFLAVDLAEQDLENILTTNQHFDPTRQTLFICEAVLMYLDEAVVDKLLAKLKKLDKNAIFVFTAMTPIGSANNNIRPLLPLYVKAKGEPMNWSIDLEDMQSFLSDRGYELLDIADGMELRRRYIPNIPPSSIHRGEFAVLTKSMSEF